MYLWEGKHGRCNHIFFADTAVDFLISFLLHAFAERTDKARYFFLFCSVAVFVFGEIYSFLSGAEYLEICIFALLYFLTTVFDPQSFGGKNK